MIIFRHVTKAYDKGVRAVKDLSLTIDDGEFVFIAGKSGSGKSTVIKLITGELKPTEGEISVNGTDLSELRHRDIPKYRRRLGIVFQDFRLLRDRNIYENIAFAQRVIGKSAAETKRNVTRMLQLTGLSAKYKFMPQELSGGEQQRAAIARALVNNPDFILADEPTGNLDEANSAEIMKLLLDINRMGTTVIVVTHSNALLESMGKRIIYMDKGRIIDDIPEDERPEQSARVKGRSRKRKPDSFYEDEEFNEYALNNGGDYL
ncbi:MAG: cell division ATP-binding protein FtsE [Eubacteriales bacterium]|nr:cell division ATP-binding protein FtsE [Eubacteriales bacterium]